MKDLVVTGMLAASLATASMMCTAAPVVLGGSIAPNTILGAGTHAVSFGGSGALPAAFQINAASFSFRFADDTDSLTIGPPQYAGQSSTNYVVSGTGTTPTYDFSTLVRTETNHEVIARVGQSESATVSLGGTTLGQGATTESFTSSIGAPQFQQRVSDGSMGFDGYNYWGTCNTIFGPIPCELYQQGYYDFFYTDYYIQTTTTTRDWAGEFSVSGSVGDLSLLDGLFNGSFVGFDLSVLGDMRLIEASLTLDITETTTGGGTPVPEPGSLALVLGGLGLLARGRRRRHDA